MTSAEVRPRRIPSLLLLLLAASTMLISLCAATVTIAGRGYWGAFVISSSALIAADRWCWIVFRRGEWARWIALLIALPSPFVILGWLPRLPHML
jgi:hypothetical protein